jgi:carboxypeptidase Taq
MADSLDDTYQRLCEHARQTMLLTTIDAIIGWDERCLMPPDGGEYRAEQMTLLAGMIHDRQTDPRIGQWLDELDDGPLTKDVDSDSAVNIRQLRRQYDKKTKLPKTLVEELARTSVLGQQVWQEARKKDDFKLLEPLLEKTFHLKRQQADALGYSGARYDALLDDYEQGETTAEVTRVLAGLREQLVPLVAEVSHSSKRPDSSILERHFPPARQELFGKETAEKIGFDFKRGRLDVTAHPFCTTLGPHDVRITTRYIDKFFNSGFFGILHEAGHGLYELGLRAEQFGLPAGEAVSLGIHESQSRWWENLVGRSRAFWQHFYPAAKTAYPEALGNVPLDAFYFAVNEVKPSLIRVEADEATYNLHILIRFELEQALIDGDLAVADLPGAWNDKYRDALGIVSPTDADGVLQDIHWSAGLIGYFATYSLGNLYAAQFFERARADLGDLDAAFAKGEFAPLLAWLREKIHRHGQRYTSGQLCERITGKPLDHDPLMRHLRSKLGPLYNL